MKKIVLCILLFFSSTMSFAVEVAHISTRPRLQVEINTIPDLTNVTSITTAGKYAWALDYDHAQIAFFDGENWQASCTIPLALSILQIVPADPVHGKMPGAWALIKTSDGPAIAYFNGTIWLKPELVANVLALKNADNIQPVSIAAANGTLFLLASTFDDYPTLLTHLSVKRSAMSAWTIPQVIIGQYDQYNYCISDEEDPVLNFLVNLDIAHTGAYYQLFTNGIATVEIGAFAQKSNAAYLITDGPNSYISYFNYAESGSYLAFKNFKTESRWHTIADYPNTRSLNGFNSDQVSRGLLCKENYQALLPEKPLNFACLSEHGSSTDWQKIPLTIYDPLHWQLITHSNGVWFVIDKKDPHGDLQTQLYHYIEDPNAVTTFDFPGGSLSALAGVNSEIELVDETAIIMCRGSTIHNLQTQPIEVYYFGSLNDKPPSWQKLTLPKTFTSCGLSLSGANIKHSINTSIGGSLWIYNK